MPKQWFVVVLCVVCFTFGYVLRGVHTWNSYEYAKEEIYNKFRRSANDQYTFYFAGVRCKPMKEGGVIVEKNTKQTDLFIGLRDAEHIKSEKKKPTTKNTTKKKGAKWPKYPVSK